MQQKPVIFLAFANDRQDNARYLRNLPLELNGIRKALQEAEKQGLCEVVERANVTVEIIFDVFQDSRYRDRIAIFHYGGHADGYQLLLESYQTLLVAGNANGSGQGLAGSATANTLAHAAGLVSFFAKQRGLALVFFNGCTTHQQAEELAKAGIPAVIGTVSEIDDHIATNLAIRFYRGIGQAMTLQRAWDEAIDELKTKNGPENPRGLDRTDPSSENNDRFPWEVYKKEGNLLEWKLEKFGNQNFNLELGTGNKNDENMNLQEFKKHLISLVDSCEMDIFFNEVENCSYDYDKPIYNSQKRNYTQTNPLLNPCAMFGQQWKVFVGTLKRKKVDTPSNYTGGQEGENIVQEGKTSHSDEINNTDKIGKITQIIVDSQSNKEHFKNIPNITDWLSEEGCTFDKEVDIDSGSKRTTIKNILKRNESCVQPIFEKLNKQSSGDSKQEVKIEDPILPPVKVPIPPSPIPKKDNTFWEKYFFHVSIALIGVIGAVLTVIIKSPEIESFDVKLSNDSTFLEASWKVKSVGKVLLKYGNQIEPFDGSVSNHKIVLDTFKAGTELKIELQAKNWLFSENDTRIHIIQKKVKQDSVTVKEEPPRTVIIGSKSQSEKTFTVTLKDESGKVLDRQTVKKGFQTFEVKGYELERLEIEQNETITLKKHD